MFRAWLCLYSLLEVIPASAAKYVGDNHGVEMITWTKSGWV